jgi:hypothetical protein
MKRRLAMLVVALLGISTPAFAQRFVVVNGTSLSGSQITLLERWNCSAIPNGRYWLNVHTGAWGYAGNPFVQGYFGQYCRTAQQRQSLSARGLLFSHQDFRNRW